MCPGRSIAFYSGDGSGMVDGNAVSCIGFILSDLLDISSLTSCILRNDWYSFREMPTSPLDHSDHYGFI